MGFEIDLPETDEGVEVVGAAADIEVYLAKTTESDILTRKLDLADWTDATNKGRVLVGKEELWNEDKINGEWQTEDVEWTVLLMNKS